VTGNTAIDALNYTVNDHLPFVYSFPQDMVNICQNFSNLLQHGQSVLDYKPTSNAKKHLLDEGKKETTVVVTGNTAIDALNYT
jgi:UDP-N-acetylglucosamine 2-epimerase